jgi:GNAT superfamily N-acetyltransferase
MKPTRNPIIWNLQTLGYGDTDILNSLIQFENEMGLDISSQIPQFGLLSGVQVVAAIWVEPDGGLFTVATSPHSQGRGYARKLLEKLIDYGTEQNWEFLVCDAIHPASVHLCQELGFVNRGGLEWYLSLDQS